MTVGILIANGILIAVVLLIIGFAFGSNKYLDQSFKVTAILLSIVGVLYGLGLLTGIYCF